MISIEVVFSIIMLCIFVPLLIIMCLVKANDTYTYSHRFRYKIKEIKSPSKTRYKIYRKYYFMPIYVSLSTCTYIKLNQAIEIMNIIKEKDKSSKKKSRWVTDDEMMVENL